MPTTVSSEIFCKLLDNSIYGKCLENLRKILIIELCNNTQIITKILCSLNFKSYTIFYENCVAVKRQKPSIWMQRSSYTGFAILELLKMLTQISISIFFKCILKIVEVFFLFIRIPSLTTQFGSLAKGYGDQQLSEYPQNHTL